MRGRRPKPTAVKEALNNPGKRALNKHEPQPLGIPDCPPHLDPIAQEEWARVSVELIQCGLLTNVDRGALAGYCCAYSRWAKAEDNIQRFGEVVQGPRGGFVKNPYVNIARDALDQMRKFCAEFGMTPSARSRVTIGQGQNPNLGARQPAEDPADKYFTVSAVAAGSKRVQ